MPLATTRFPDHPDYQIDVCECVDLHLTGRLCYSPRTTEYALSYQEWLRDRPCDATATTRRPRRGSGANSCLDGSARAGHYGSVVSAFGRTTGGDEGERDLEFPLSCCTARLRYRWLGCCAAPGRDDR